jgi:hypothetical protein
MDIVPPFQPARPESVGEVQQRLASYIANLAHLEGLTLTEGEREAVAKVIGVLFRKWPILREWEKVLYEAVHSALP